MSNRESGVEFFVTPGYGETFLEQRHYHQAVKIGDRVEISGQGGWDESISFPESLTDEIVRAFDNVGRTLTAAGVRWSDVVAVDSYHVPAEQDSIGSAHTDVMIDQFRTRMPDRRPIWTMTAVPVLAAPKMRVEIRVTAIVDER